MVKGRRFVLKRSFEGLPKPEDFELVEEELPELQDGDFLFRYTLHKLRRKYVSQKTVQKYLPSYYLT